MKRRDLISKIESAGTQRGQELILDIYSIQGGITKLGRSANVPVGFVGASGRGGPQRSHWMEKISALTDGHYNVSDQ